MLEEWWFGDLEDEARGELVPGILRGDYGISLEEMDIFMDLATYDSDSYYVVLALARLLLNRTLPMKG